jgi:hypothetical protein
MSDEIDGEDLNPILDAIDAAEEIPDPLDGLVEKSAEDPGAAFTPEVLERLVALKSEDRAEHRETWPVRTKGFRRRLARQFFEQTGGAPSSEALQSALNVIEAKAHFDGPERPVFIRVGGLDGRLYLDLGDEAWRAVEIDATGWRIIDKSPVRF